MQRAALVASLSLGVALGGSTVAAGQEAFREFPGAGQGEGHRVFIAAADGLMLHRTPDLLSASYVIPYRAGWLIPSGGSIVRTITPAENIIVQAGTIRACCDVPDGSGCRGKFLELSVGQRWTYLYYAAEGAVRAIIQDEVCYIPAHPEPGLFGEDLLVPEVQWWIRVLYADGTSPGWLSVHDNSEINVTRSF